MQYRIGLASDSLIQMPPIKIVFEQAQEPIKEIMKTLKISNAVLAPNSWVSLDGCFQKKRFILLISSPPGLHPWQCLKISVDLA